MKTQRSKARVLVGVCAVTALLGFSLLAFAGDFGLSGAAAGDIGAAGLSVDFVPAPQPTSVMFIKFDGVEGEAADQDHRGWSEILSFSQAHQTGAPGTGPVLRAGGCVFEDIVVTKELDKSSPKLAEAVCKGKVFAKAEIHAARPSGAGNQIYLKYEMENVLISSYHLGGPSQSDSLPTEQIAFNFEKIKMTYTEYDDAGKPGADVEYSWKVAGGMRL